MADTQLLIEIGAKLDQLLSASEQSKEEISSIREHAESATEAFKSLAEVLGITFTVEGIKQYIEAMAELGLQTERTAAMLGLSTEDTVQLGGVAKLTGTDMETLALGIERISLSVQRSTRDSINPQAQALKVLGLSARDLINTPTSEYIDKLHDAVSKFGSSLNLTNAVMQIGGRGIAQLIPLLQVSGERWREMKEQVDAAREGLARAVPGMADTHEKITLLSLSMQSLGARVFNVLKPAIDALVTSITNWVQSLDEKTIGQIVLKIGTVVLDVVASIGHLVAQIDALLDRISAKASAFATVMRTISGFIASGVGSAVGTSFPAVTFATGISAASGLGTGAAADQSASEQSKFDQTIAQMRKTFESFVSGYVSGTRTMDAAVDEFHQRQKLSAKAIDEGAAQAAAAQIKFAEAQIKTAEQVYEQDIERINKGVEAHSLSEGQKLALTFAAINKREDLELSVVNRELADGQLSAEQRATFEAKKTEIVNKAVLDRIKASDKERQQVRAQYEQIAQGITSAFSSQFGAILSGTESFSAGMQKAFAELATKVIENLLKVAAEMLIIKALMAVFGGGGAGGIVSGVLGAAFSGKVPGGHSGVWNVASAAGGSFEVNPGLFQLHDQEVVLPPAAGKAFRNMAENGSPAGGGDNHVHFNVMAQNPRSMAAALNNPSSGLSQAIQRGMRDGTLKIPRR